MSPPPQEYNTHVNDYRTNKCPNILKKCLEVTHTPESILFSTHMSHHKQLTHVL